MKWYLKYLPVLFLSCLLFGCGENPSRGAYYNLDVMPHGVILLNKWQIVGPFPSNGKSHYLEKDNLQQFGLNEKTVTYGQFLNIQPEDSTKGIRNEYYFSDSYRTDFNKVFHYADSTSINGNVYCACILHSGRNRELKLNFSSDDGSKVWFNHKLIYSCDRINGIKYYDNYLSLNLKKGNNLLLVKVHNVKLSWQMFADVEIETEARLKRYRRTFALEFGDYYLERSTIAGDTIALNDNMPSDKFRLTVKTPAGKTILSDSGSDAGKAFWIIPGLKEGLYSTTFYDRDEIFHEEFYKGDIVKAIHTILNELHRFRLRGDTKNNVAALAFRYFHLLKPKNMGISVNDKRDWDKKMIFLFVSLRRYYRNLSRGLPPDHNATGGMLRSYVSKIDGGVQYYQLFVPKQYMNGKSLPLVIELPKYVEWHSSPLSTYRFANIRLFSQFEDLANKYDVIIFAPSCRTIDKSNMNTIDEAAFWEALANVRKTFDVDTTRMYLRGACLSSRTAMDLAVKYPDRFAAMAMVAPQLTVSTENNIYLQQNEPLNYLRNISNLPILDIHSRLDPHSPVSISDKLNADVKLLGFRNFTYRRLRFEFGKYYSAQYLSDIFAFFLKYSLHPSPRQIYFSTSEMRYHKSFWLTLNEITYGKIASVHAKIMDDTLRIETKHIQSFTVDFRTLPYPGGNPLTILDNGKEIYDAVPHRRSYTFGSPSSGARTKNPNIEGPFADVFTAPFALVPGTIGSARETKRLRALADTIETYWKSRYYSGCRLIEDRDITPEDMRAYSLVLLGTPHSNLVFERLADRLPERIYRDSVRIGKRTAVGSHLCFYFIYPNPDARDRYVAVIGYNNPKFISLGYEKDDKARRFDDVSDYGWYDYKIWDAASSATRMSGYFSYLWK